MNNEKFQNLTLTLYEIYNDLGYKAWPIGISKHGVISDMNMKLNLMAWNDFEGKSKTHHELIKCYIANMLPGWTFRVMQNTKMYYWENPMMHAVYNLITQKDKFQYMKLKFTDESKLSTDHYNIESEKLGVYLAESELTSKERAKVNFRLNNKDSHKDITTRVIKNADINLNNIIQDLFVLLTFLVSKNKISCDYIHLTCLNSNELIDKNLKFKFAKNIYKLIFLILYESNVFYVRENLENIHKNFTPLQNKPPLTEEYEHSKIKRIKNLIERSKKDEPFRTTLKKAKLQSRNS